MKKIMKKNQIIITALAIMIVVAGYLNFTGQEISTSGLVNSRQKEETKSEKKISEDSLSSDEDKYVVNDDGEVVESKEDTQETVASQDNPGEAVMVSNNIKGDYFSSAKLTREQNRAKNKETLLDIINNKSLASKDKRAAVNKVAQMTDASEKESAAELMLEAKGFSEAVVSLNDKKADVVVNAKNLTDKDIAQIEDIVKRKTDVSAENIVITPVNVK